MTLRLNGSTSGYTEIDAPAVAGSNTLVLPTGAGSANQFLKNGSTAGSLGWSSLVEDSSGRLLVGTSTAAFSSSYLTVKGGVSTSVGEVCIASTSTNIANNDDIGAIRFTNTDGGRAAQILATSDGTWGTNDYPGRLSFSTTADGASSPTERFRISSTGAQSSVIPGGSTLYPSFDCRAWVSYSGNSSSIRSSGNVSSVTKTSTGSYTVNFSTAMPDDNYSLCGACKGVAATFTGVFSENHDGTRSASAIAVASNRRDNGGSFDTDYLSAAIFR